MYSIVRFKKIFINKKKNFLKIFNSFKNFKSFKILKHLQNDNFQSSYYCISLILNSNLIKHRKKIIKKLNANGLGTSIYYPKPVPLLQYYKENINLKTNILKYLKLLVIILFACQLANI